MHEIQKDLVEMIHHSLAASSAADSLTCLPAFLIQCPYKQADLGTAADWALTYYSSIGLYGDRTRMNLWGYPGLLRDLSAPPPWVEVKPEDVDGDISHERALELRSLIMYAQEHSEEELVARYQASVEHKASVLQPFLGISPDANSIIIDFEADSFRQVISLAKSLGVETFEAIYEAVFDFDEFSVASGTPDIFLWLSGQGQSLWFFSEVKAPGDSLRNSQKAWLHEHWKLVCGHYALTILE